MNPRFIGMYHLTIPYLWFFKPKLALEYTKSQKQMNADLDFLWFHHRFKLIKEKDMSLVFSKQFETFDVELVLFFYHENEFLGIFDTPIGHIKLHGKRKKKKKKSKGWITIN